MPEPDCFLRYCRNAATQNFITLGKIPHIRIGGPSLQRGVVLNGFIHRKPSEHLCQRYVCSTKCPSSYPCKITMVQCCKQRGYQLMLYRVKTYLTCLAVIQFRRPSQSRCLPAVCLSKVTYSTFSATSIFLPHLRTPT